MSNYKKSGNSKGGRKRKNEDQYDLQTILDEDEDAADLDVVEPAAAARNAETNDGVSFTICGCKFCYEIHKPLPDCGGTICCA